MTETTAKVAADSTANHEDEAKAAAEQLKAMQAEGGKEAPKPQPQGEDAGDAPESEPAAASDSGKEAAGDFSFEKDDSESSETGKSSVVEADVIEQINKHGKFSDYYKDKLKKAGRSAEEIGFLEAGALAKLAEVKANFAQHAGGEQFGSVLAWAKDALPKEELAYYSQSANSRDAMQRQAAARDLYARYKEANPSSTHLNGKGPAPVSNENPLGQVTNPYDFINKVMNNPSRTTGGVAGQKFQEAAARSAIELVDSMGISTKVYGKGETKQ